MHSERCGLTCTAGCSVRRRSGPSPQLCVTGAEMLTPDFGELQGRTACQGLSEAQHNAANRIRSRTSLTFSFTHNVVSIRQHSKRRAARGCRLRWGCRRAGCDRGACCMRSNSMIRSREEFGTYIWVRSGRFCFIIPENDFPHEAAGQLKMQLPFWLEQQCAHPMVTLND